MPLLRRPPRHVFRALSLPLAVAALILGSGLWPRRAEPARQQWPAPPVTFAAAGPIAGRAGDDGAWQRWLVPPASASPAAAGAAETMVAAAAPYLIDPQALRDDPLAFAGQGTVELYHLRYEQAEADGLSAQVVQRVFQIRDAADADLFALDDLWYDSSRNRFLLWRAQVLRDGRVLSAAPGADEGNLTADDGNQPRHVALPPLEAGDRINVVYVLLPDASSDWSLLKGRLLGDLFAFEDSYPTEHVSYVLKSARPLAVSQVGLPAVTPRHDASGYCWSWQAYDQPAFFNQPDGVAITDRSPYVQTSGFDSWAQLADWYGGVLAARSRMPAPLEQRLKAVAAAAPAGVHAIEVSSEGSRRETDRKIVDRVWGALAARLSYRGDESGVHAYVPADISQVMRSGRGDCKDGALLLSSWLRAEGVEAYVALVRTSSMGPVALPAANGTVAATLAAFDHALVYVPSTGEWIDTTAPRYLATELPSSDQNALALIVRPGENQLVHIPVTPADSNLTVREVALTPEGPGRLRAEGSVEVHGADAPDWRGEYTDRAHQRSQFQEWLQHYYPGAQVETVAVSGVNPSASTVLLHFTASLPQDNAPAMAWAPRQYAALLASQAQRNEALNLPLRWTTREAWSLQLPAGDSCEDQTSTPVELKSAFGELDIRTSCSDGTLRVSTNVVQNASVILPQQYAQFRAFWQGVDRQLDAPAPGFVASDATTRRVVPAIIAAEIR